MKNLIILIILSTISFSCQGQKIKEIDLSSNTEMNYVFAFLEPKKVIQKELYNHFLFISIYPINDWLSTPNNFSPTDGEDVLNSYFISVKTADSYTNTNDSKLFKITGFYDAKILEVQEEKYPNFMIKFQYGLIGEKKIKIFKFKGVQ